MRKGLVGALQGMRGDLVKLEEAVLQAVTCASRRLIGVGIGIEDHLLAHSLTKDLTPPWTIRIVGHDVK
jgi:hypothetical protein